MQTTPKPIRPPVAADHPRWLELWQGYLDFYEEDLPPEITARSWATLLDPAGAIRALLVEDPTGRVVGFAHFFIHPSTWSARGYCYLEDLFVDPALRGGGYGRALIEAVADYARAEQSDMLYWLTQEKNATARRLYDSLAELSPFVRYTRKP